MQIINVDFDDNGDSFSLKLQIVKPGYVPSKPKPPPPVTPPPKVQTPPPPQMPPKPKPKFDMKTLATVASKMKPQSPPKKKEEKKVETKEEKLKKRDPFFETEEYPVSFTI